MYNEFMAAITSILNNNKSLWGMQQPWADFDDRLVPRLPAGVVLFLGDDRKWVTFPRTLEHYITCQVWYYYEQAEQQVNESKLRANIESIAKVLTEYITLNNADLTGQGDSCYDSGMDVNIGKAFVAGGAVMAGVVNFWVKVREVITFKGM